MAFRSWPHDYEPDGTTEQETYESDFRFSLTAATQDGLDPSFGTALDASVSGNNLDLGTGRGVLDGYAFASDTTESVSIPTNSSSLPRLYRVVARLDVAAHQILPHVIEGTAASNPQIPSLTRTDAIYDLPVWRCRRGGGGGSITELVDERTYLNPAGALACTSSTRPPNPLPGTTIYESDTGRLVYYHDGQWVTAADGTYPTSWQPIPLRTGRYTTPAHGWSPSWRWVRPGRVELRGTVARVDGGSIASGDYFAILPSAIRPGAYVRHMGGASQTSAGWSVRLEIRSRNVTESGQITLWHGYNPTWFALDGWTYDIS
ncbi:hypothetical protein [Nocardiopsis ganjiahuensis]|uniref:hypothetical protein n=1 Tax=Nocardiopsis ganjiahuensis TaxID=239984 RepID=UPI00034A4135|nr:hypothetical protein [Nocardiopsis ganjiahuensis]